MKNLISAGVSRSIWTGTKAITEPFPIHAAAELDPISRLTELRTACQSALVFPRTVLDQTSVEIGPSQAALSRKSVIERRGTALNSMTLRNTRATGTFTLVKRGATYLLKSRIRPFSPI
jgi:hypothetical protein